MSRGESAYCSCKVGRVIEKYGLEEVYDEIRRRREQEDDSLRTLAEFLSTRVLRRAIEIHADREVLVDAASVYSTLANGADAGAVAETRERLATAGVPVEDVADDFVSHQTVRTHLNGCLDVDTGRSGTTDPEEVADLIEWARNRDERIIDRAVSRLREAGHLQIGETNVIHSVRVICDACGRSHRVQELLDDRRCECGGTG